MRISLFGGGTVGRATAHFLALAHDVDVSDPLLAERAPAALADFTTGDLHHWRRAEAFVLCVGSLRNRATGALSDRQVRSVLEQLRRYGLLRPKVPVIIRTTLMPGTCAALARAYDVRVVHWPEFGEHWRMDESLRLAPYVAWGWAGDEAGAEHRATDVFRHLWVPAWQQTPAGKVTGCLMPTLFLRPAHATETVKLVANALRAAQVVIAEQLAAPYETATGGDWNAEVVPLLNADPRIGDTFEISAPHGFGGACLPKDVEALLSFADSSVLSEVLASNWVLRGRLAREERKMFSEDSRLDPCQE